MLPINAANKCCQYAASSPVNTIFPERLAMWMIKARKLFKTIGFEATTLFYAFRDPATPGKLKVLAVLMLMYLISPIDLVPDFLAVFGWADDVAVLALGIPAIVKRLPEQVRRLAEEKAMRLMSRFNWPA
jgi:uncharacterized membrane protein YkvA (DUF1232 family)